MGTAAHTRRLTAATFHEALGSAPWLLVRIEPGLPRMHKGVARFFAHQYPGLFAFGTLPVRETRSPGWWEDHFRTAVGPVKGGRTGYFLLQEGQVVGHHTGLVRADVTFTDRTRSADEARRSDREVEWLKRIAFGTAPVSTLDLAAAVELIAYFDGIVLTRQERAGFADGESKRTGAAGRVAPQPVPIPGESGDPFQVLKVPFDATDEEIRAAYKKQMKLNHPDKVGHMSPEIQAYAAAQVRVIKAAFDALKAVRGEG